MLWSCRYFATNWVTNCVGVGNGLTTERCPSSKKKKYKKNKHKRNKKLGLSHTANVTFRPRRQLIQSETIAPAIFVAHFTYFVPHCTPTNVTQSKKHVNLTREIRKRQKKKHKQQKSAKIETAKHNFKYPQDNNGRPKKV